MARLKHECDFRLHLAAQECDQMAATLRERLVQTISQKRSRLMREKEQLDIADTNALLLHPNQFSITNPSSPGGLQSNRKTRHTRHRVDMDEFGNGIVSEPLRTGTGPGKGGPKRKAPAPDDEQGSPARDGGATTPAERAKMLQQQAPPSYSLSSLFTDKELAMHSNTAHVATAHFFSVSKKANAQGGRLASQGENTDGDETPGDGTGQEDNATPGATDMERTTSQNFHATRSTRGQGGTAALNLLGELADKTATRPPLPYFSLNNYPGRVNNNNVPPPSTLMPEEVEDDMAKMERLMNSKPRGWVDKNLIEQVLPENHTVDEASGLGGAGSLDLRFPVRMDVHLVPLKRGDESASAGNGGGGGGNAAKRQKVA